MRVPVQKTEASSAVAASPRGTPHFATVVVTVGYVFSQPTTLILNIICSVTKMIWKCDITSYNYLFPTASQ